jgi:hypothetical protein
MREKEEKKEKRRCYNGGMNGRLHRSKISRLSEPKTLALVRYGTD